MPSNMRSKLEISCSRWRNRRGDLVCSHPAIGRGNTPLRLDQLGLQQPLKRWIKRALFHLQQVPGSLLDVLNQGVSVGGFAAQRIEDHHLECPGKKIA